MKILFNILFLILCFNVVDISAQIKDSRDFARQSQQTADSLIKSNLPDTIILRYFKLSDITTFYDFQDSTLDNFFHQYDPAKRRWIDYQNLGNAGSAARSQIYESKPYIGFDEGLNQYDLYNFELDDFRFYENNTPLTNVFFTPVGGQQNFVIRSDFARSFNDGTSISLNYRRIRQQGFYSNQLTKTTNFGVSLRYQSENKRYTGFLSILSNVNEEGQNGGIALDSFFLNPQLGDRANVPIVIDDAQTRHQQKQYSLINYYKLYKTENNKVQYLLRHDLKFDSRYYKFNDATTRSSSDSLEYGQFNIEDRGIRFYNKIDKISNAFYAYASDGKRLNIRAGLVYDRYDIDQLGIESGFDNLYADFKGDVPITESIAIKSTGQLGLGDGAGDFHFKGSLNLDLGSWIDLNGGAAFYRYTPDLTSRSLVINGLQVWENELIKPVGSDLFGEFEIPKLRIKGNIKQSLITNAIYYDSTSTVRQSEDIFSSTSLTVANEFSFGKVGMENYALFQFFSDNIYNLPTLSTKHNLHITGYLFDRALYGRVGAEIRLTPSHTGSDYSQVIGQFRQSNEELGFYPMTDIYFTGKVKTFRLFLRFENVNFLIKDDVSYQIVNYPQFDFKFRFGISWLLLN